MHPFKAFMVKIRKAEVSEPNVYLYGNVTAKLYDYVRAFDIKFQDGHYEAYSGEVKTIIINFITFWTDVINECVKIGDAWKHTMDKEGLLSLIDKTLENHRAKHLKFEELFLPAESEEEQKICDEIKALHEIRLQDYHSMKEKIEDFDTIQVVTDFVEVNFEISIRKKNEFFYLTHTCMALELAKYTHRIRDSFEEIILRVRKNIGILKAEYDRQLNARLDELYDANKDKVNVSRQEKHRTTDTAEVEWAITRIRDKIEYHGINMPFAHLNKELDYWVTRLRDFLEIEKAITKLREELEEVNEYLKQYESLRSTEYPGSKKTCWEIMGENLNRRKIYLEETFIEAAKALVTFFAVKGQDRILYKDHVGTYTIDDYGHQIYIEDSGNIANHVLCDGTRFQYSDLGKYYFDEHGRYIIDEITGEKKYQRAYCGSLYKLDDNDIFVKLTKDCGHSVMHNSSCKMQIRNPNLIELLPKYDPVDIKNSLTSEAVNYLWDNIGHLMPEALNKIGLKESRNPIYSLGQRLIQLKYQNSTFSQLAQKKKEADEYKKNIYTAKKENAIKLYKDWKAKQVKRRKPEESDDSDMKMAFHNYLTELCAADIQMRCNL